jgi:hypothetical protein
LAKKPGERRDARHREHEHGHAQRHQRIGAAQPGEVVHALDRLALPAHRDQHGEGADGHGDVDGDVDQHAAQPVLAADGQAHQREADMTDRGVGHQPLDVALPDGGQRAQRHRAERDQHDDPAATARQLAEGPASTRVSSATAATLGAAEKKAVTGVGAPS